jgi:hypothetical protein
VRDEVHRQATSSNFGFLGVRYPELERIAARSERYFSEDPIPQSPVSSTPAKWRLPEAAGGRMCRFGKYWTPRPTSNQIGPSRKRSSELFDRFAWPDI